MRILHTSDWHADWLSSGVDRFDDVEGAVWQTVKAANDEGVDLYVFTGDLTNPDDAPRALRAVALALDVACALAEVGIPSWWVAGNHDVVEDGSGRTTLHPLTRLHGYRQRGLVTVFESPASAILCPQDRSTGVQAWKNARRAIVLPYPSVSRAYDPAAEVEHLKKGRLPVSFVCGHLQVEGATPGDETTEMGRGRDVFWPFEALDPQWTLLGGHYHDRQVFERGGRRLTVPGSIARLNHGEEKNRPGYLLWDLL